MSIPGLIVSTIILALVLAWVGAPFIQRHIDTAPRDNATLRQRERLQIYYERVLRNLHDLDEDFATGKLNGGDYHTDRALWAQRGVAALRALDTLDSEHLVAPETADDAAVDAAIDAFIENAIKQVRDAPGTP